MHKLPDIALHPIDACYAEDRGQLTVRASPLFGVLHLDHDGKSVTVFHVLDQGEMHLPEKGLAQLIELETGERMQVDFSDIRHVYAAKVERFLNELRLGCANLRADYVLAPTQEEVHDALFMRSRAR